MRTASRQARTLLIAGVACALAACVTEREPRRSGLGYAGGTPVRGSREASDRVIAEGPIAAPAPPGSTATTHVRVQVVPLGSVSYDGAVLPLLSPRGDLVAVQQGVGPTWATMLAAPDALPPVETTLVVYRLSTEGAERVPYDESIPRGLMLGRDADARGFLVESPRPDGARWIGRVLWATGRVEWLVQDGSVNAHAVLLPGGGLAYTRRAIREGRSTLVVRTEAGESTRDVADVSYALPMVVGRSETLFVLARSALGIEIEAISLRQGDGRPGLGATVARRRLTTTSDMVAAFQIAASVDMPPPMDGERTDDDPPALAILHPDAKRMAVFDVATSALLPLAPDSMGASVWTHQGRRGWFCATPDGLTYTPQPAEVSMGSLPDRMLAARVLAGVYQPRRTSDPLRPFVLIGADPRRPDRLTFFGMRPTADGG